ncbi:Chalcone 4'-O-glucosyltransferase [Sesamum alatum]|uniref:Chalcone 4'-O-glucosyltransferase n=1 Tax=Sesamum alatum TaxID=300844 RepID=A0AAE2CVS7_9LAMI|nr:Chalcone 4'-O-glucosyltransferase [Sesamum alatum]
MGGGGRGGWRCWVGADGGAKEASKGRSAAEVRDIGKDGVLPASGCVEGRAGAAIGLWVRRRVGGGAAAKMRAISSQTASILQHLPPQMGASGHSEWQTASFFGLHQSTSIPCNVLLPSSPNTTLPSPSYCLALPPSPLLPSLTTASLPQNSTSNPMELLFEIPRLTNSNLREALQEIQQKSNIVIDFFCNSAFEVSTSLNIPTYFWFSSGAFGLCLFLHSRNYYWRPRGFEQFLAAHYATPRVCSP